MSKKLILLFAVVFCILMNTLSVSALGDSKNSSKDRIHFLNVFNGDAILLESDGHFAMVDVGEDTNYPDGKDPRYPLRPGITINEGYEKKVIQYLKQNGVSKLDFIVATHAHSDHIGSIPNILDHFNGKVDKIYAKVYEDEYISNPARLWDNLYVYDRMMKGALKYNIPVQQKFNEINTKFTLGDMQIQLFNYDVKTDDYGNIKQRNDENENCLGVKVTLGSNSAFLAGDIQNTDGDEDRLGTDIGKVDLLKIGHHGLSSSSSRNFLEALKPTIAVNSGLFANFSQQILDTFAEIGADIYLTESYLDSVIAEFDLDNIKIINGDKINSNKIMKYSPENSAFYYYENDQMIVNKWAKIYWRGILSDYYFLDTGKAATGFNCIDNNIYYMNGSGVLLKNTWLKLNSNMYYLDKFGIVQKGWLFYEDKRYYLSEADGIMQTGWIFDDGKWYYLSNTDGAMQTGWIFDEDKWYYLSNTDGTMQTGWIFDNGKWYYLSNPDGAMRTGWIFDDSKWYYLRYDWGGAMLEGGWLWDNDYQAWFYLRPDWGGAMARDQWVLTNGIWYYVGSNGAMV